MISQWTTEFTASNDVWHTGISHFKNISQLCSECIFIFKNKKCFVILNLDEEHCLEGKTILKHVAAAESEIIADIISWEYEVGLVELKTTCGISKKIKIPSKKPVKDANFSYTGILTGKMTEENLDLLGGYRQIRNESNLALRYLMHYRILEVIASNYGSSIDALLRKYKIKAKFRYDKRNKNKTVSLISYFRNKIHPTKKSYRFPSKELINYLPEIEKITNSIISNIIK